MASDDDTVGTNVVDKLYARDIAQGGDRSRAAWMLSKGRADARHEVAKAKLMFESLTQAERDSLYQEISDATGAAAYCTAWLSDHATKGKP